MRIFLFLILLSVSTIGFSQIQCQSGELVFIDDLALQNALIEELGPTDAYTCDGLLSLTSLRLVNKGIQDVSGLVHAGNLASLNLTSNEIVDFTPLVALKQLKTLVLNNNKIEMVSNIGELESLRNLQLKNNQLTSLPENLESNSLITLNISDNDISDIAPIIGLKKIKTLDVSDNPIPYDGLRNIASLEELTNLSLNTMNISNLNQVFSLVYDYEALEVLNVNNNAISDWSLVPNFTSLKFLQANSNSIADTGPFARASQTLERLFLSDNEIRDLQPLANLQNLKILVLSKNNISNVSSLSQLQTLERLSLDRNFIVDVMPLGELESLSILILNTNRIRTIEGLEGLSNLTQLRVTGNYIDNLDQFLTNSEFGELPKSLLAVNSNCLTSYDRRKLASLEANENVRVVFDRQKNLKSYFCVYGEPRPLLEIQLDGTSPINIGR